MDADNHIDLAGRAAQVSWPTSGPFTQNSLGLLQWILDEWCRRGLTMVDLPWLVPSAFSDATRPEFSRDLRTPQGSLVGSGEQSFLYMWSQGLLPAAAAGYVGWTPCFRDENVDELHQHAFMKVEWFIPLAPENVQRWALRMAQMIVAQEVLFLALAKHVNPNAEAAFSIVRISDDQFDINLNGIEVGSYGFRPFGSKCYLYGTGLALPRFNQALGACRGESQFTDATPTSKHTA